MFTFLNSAILLGLAAVSIPILIHLFTRQKSKIVNFSSLKFLRELQKQQIRKIKIRQILLLILRTLLILAIVLAFARPTLKSGDAASLESSAQLTAVIILDNTMSMGRMSDGRRLLDRAKDRALEVLSMLRQGDEVYLIYPQNPPRFAHDDARYSLTSVRDLIENTEISYAGTDYLTAFLAANKIMQKSSNINKEVYLISDLQANGLNLTGFDQNEKLFSEDVKLFVLPVQALDSENLAVSKVAIGNQLLEQGKVAELEVQVRNLGEDSAGNKLVHLFVNGKRVAQNLLDINAQSAVNALFRIVPQKAGFQSGYVMLEDDILSEDNRRYFAFHISEHIPVLIAGHGKSDTQYIRLALQPKDDVASYLDITEIMQHELDEIDLNKFKAVILSNVPKFTAATVLKLQSFVKAGGGLMLFLGENVDLRNYNEHLHKKLRLPSITQTVSKESENQFLSLGKIDFSHPIFRGVFEDDKFVETPHVRFAVDVDSKPSVDEIIEYSNGSPFLFETKLQSGRILYVTTSLARAWSDLVVKGFFVPLVNRSVFYLAEAASGENEQVSIGSELTFGSNAHAAGADLFMKKPDGARVKIKPEISKGHFLIRFTETDLPGIYGLYNHDKLLAQWACNYDASESNGAEFAVEALGEIISETQLVEIKEQNSVAESLQQSRFGREFWKSFLAMAFVLLVAETVLSRSPKQKRHEVKA